MKIQIRKIAAVLALGSLAVLAGCGGGDDDIGQIIGTSSPQYRTVHALSLIHISEPTRQPATSRMPSSA